VISLEATDIRGSIRWRSRSCRTLPLSCHFILEAGAAGSRPGLLRRPAHLVALIKPQFEAGRKHVKKGIVRDRRGQHGRCARTCRQFVASLGWTVAGVIPSPIEGGEGNREFLARASRD